MNGSGCALCGESWVVGALPCHCRAGSHRVCLIYCLKVRHGEAALPCQVPVAAARELGCSDAYIHVRPKRAALTLAQVLEAPGLDVLLHGRG